MRASVNVADIRKIHCWDSIEENAVKFKNDIENELKIPVVIEKSKKEAVEKADIVISTTRGKGPVIAVSYTHLAYTAEDLDRYYTYQIHRAAAADFGSNTKADHVAVLNTIEKINDYPEMLKVYKSMGRGSSFLKHEQKEAGSWVTPDMILGYERNRMQSIYQKHYDRIEALKAAETGTDEEKAQAAKEYAETAKRFDKIGSDISLQISLNDIIAAEELKQSVKMSIHDRRIEELISTDENLTDEDKIRCV